MRSVVDESTDARLVPHLIGLGHDATLISRSHHPGLPDEDVLAVALSEGRILLTDDRDFGELVFRLRLPNTGVIYFRLRTTLIAVALPDSTTSSSTTHISSINSLS